MDYDAFVDLQKRMANNEVDLADKILDKNLDQSERLLSRMAAQAVIKGAETIMANPTAGK